MKMVGKISYVDVTMESRGVLKVHVIEIKMMT